MYFQPAKTLYSCAGIPGNHKRSHGGDVFQWNEITRTGRAWLQLLRPKGGATMRNISLVWIRMVFQLFQQKLGECRNWWISPHLTGSLEAEDTFFNLFLLGFPSPKLDDPKVTRPSAIPVWLSIWICLLNRGDPTVAKKMSSMMVKHQFWEPIFRAHV